MGRRHNILSLSTCVELNLEDVSTACCMTGRMEKENKTETE